MIQTRYDETSPCTRCGSSMEDCDCCAEYELRSSMSALGIGTHPGYLTDYLLTTKLGSPASYDDAATYRMLREFGY